MSSAIRDAAGKGATAKGQQGRASRVIQGRDGRRYAFADHNCFACGGQNAIGMRLEIELGDGTARTEWRAGADYVGWEDKIHGGILATLLDEVMAWAPSSYDSWAVTAERFRSRMPISRSSPRACSRLILKARSVNACALRRRPRLAERSPRVAASQ